MNKAQLDEFFIHLSAEYKKWKKDSNSFPFFDLSNQLNGTIFSYSGWDTTGNIRNTSDKNIVLKSMLERSLSKPATIIDVGTYDGKRLKDIIDSLSIDAYKNIISIKGIDINSEALSKAKKRFENGEKTFEQHSGKIENINSSNLGDERKIILYLDNILLNIRDESSIVPFLSKKSNKEDIIILEAHKKINNNLYPENIEQFFTEYFVKSGIKEILGGRLASTFSEDGKHVYIEDLPKEVRHKNKSYQFENHFLDQFGHKCIIEPVICLGISRILKNNWYFMWNMIENGFEAPFKEDVQIVNDDILMRLEHVHDKKFFQNLMKRKDLSLEAYGGNKLDYILRFKKYPKHYDTHPLIGRHADQVEIVEGSYGR